MKSIRMMVRTGIGAGVTGAVLIWAPLSLAAETADDAVFFKMPRSEFKASFERLRMAQESVFANPSVQKLFKSQDSVNALSLVQRVTDEEIETTKFQHFFKGIEVIGSKVFHHAGFGFETVNSEVMAFNLETVPSLSVDKAVSLAQASSQVAGADEFLDGVPELKILPSQTEETARLIFWVGFKSSPEQAGRDVLVDAHSGEILADISRHIEIAPVTVRTTRIGGKDIPGCQQVAANGRPVDLLVSACTQVVTNGKVPATADSSVRSAATNAKKVLTYFMSRHGRNSYDNNGSASVSLVHIGKNFDNAFWSSDMKLMAYGDGDGVETGDFTRAVDVAGHEMTHGVVSSTAKLIYMDESGALNEAFADFFGKMIANDGDWAIGKKIFLKPSQGIRDLAKPSIMKVCAARDFSGNCTDLRPYPTTYKDRFPKQPSCGPQNDNCWVHVNSTIGGHAMYRVSQAITKLKAERLFYLVLTHYMDQNSNFKAFGTKSVQACGKLYDTVTCGKVKTVMTQMGLL